jgi:hypothetical protein
MPARTYTALIFGSWYPQREVLLAALVLPYTDHPRDAACNLLTSEQVQNLLNQVEALPQYREDYSGMDAFTLIYQHNGVPVCRELWREIRGSQAQDAPGIVRTQSGRRWERESDQYEERLDPAMLVFPLL